MKADIFLSLMGIRSYFCLLLYFLIEGIVKPGSSDADQSKTLSGFFILFYFMQHLDITFRRDPTNYRPRINKLESLKDREQKSAGSYYYLDD